MAVSKEVVRRIQEADRVYDNIFREHPIGEAINGPSLMPPRRSTRSPRSMTGCRVQIDGYGSVVPYK